MMITVRIGSDPRCDLRVADEYASSWHCKITLSPGADPWTGWILADLGSTNGTAVVRDGTRHKIGLGNQWQLQPGDRIVVGRTTLPPFTPQAIT